MSTYRSEDDPLVIGPQWIDQIQALHLTFWAFPPFSWSERQPGSWNQKPIWQHLTLEIQIGLPCAELFFENDSFQFGEETEWFRILLKIHSVSDNYVCWWKQWSEYKIEIQPSVISVSCGMNLSTVWRVAEFHFFMRRPQNRMKKVVQPEIFIPARSLVSNSWNL